MPRIYRDWTKLKLEYASGNETLREFSRKREIGWSSLMEHSSKEDWQEAREAFRAKVSVRVEAAKVEFRARTELEIDKNHHALSGNIQQRLNALLAQDAAATKADEPADAKDGKKKGKGGKLKVLDLKLASETARGTYELDRVTAGLPSEKQPMRVELSVSDPKKALTALLDRLSEKMKGTNGRPPPKSR